MGDSSRSGVPKTRERAREEPTWSADTTNACWTAGWNGPLWSRRVRRRRRSSTTSFTQSGRPMRSTTSSSRPWRARWSPLLPKDRRTERNGWSETVSKHPKQRRKRESEWNKRDTIMKMRIPEQRRRVNDSLTEGMRRFAISLNLAKKGHEKDRKRVLGEQLDGYLTVEGLQEILQGK